jgi:putative transposase
LHNRPALEAKPLDGSIRLRAAERKAALEALRRGTDPEYRLRAHILLLLDAGHPWALIVAVLFTSTATINRWRRRYLAGGLDAVLGRPSRSAGRWWAALVIRWVTTLAPADFGFVRSRWTCEAVAVVLREDYRVGVSRETVRRRLRAAGLVWRRPRPVLGPRDPAHAYKLGRIRRLLRELPADEVAVFQDEVDINTNPKIGSMWMWRGRQAEVPTPGNNVKRYLAGSLSWRSQELILTEGQPGQGRDTDLFLAHLDELRRRLRCYRVIHVICDNAKPHQARRVREYLARHGGRVVIHYLPTYAPQTNPIERVWWHLHEEITRNHRCRDIEELLDLVFDWLAAGSRFAIETSTYDRKATA